MQKLGYYFSGTCGGIRNSSANSVNQTDFNWPRQFRLLRGGGSRLNLLAQLSCVSFFSTRCVSSLRRVQCLPSNIANVAVYCLVGARIVEQEIDYKKLSLLASVLYSENSIECELACRQMAIKGNDSNSWFVHCNHLLHKYMLPNI